MPEEEDKKVTVGLAIATGLFGLAVAATGYGLLLAWAAPPTVYTCPHCGAEFATEGERLAHIQAEHPEQPSYICPHCAEAFWTEEELQQHIELEHVLPTGDVQGHVYNMETNEPLGGVSIDIDGYTGQTNADGDYYIPSVRTGTYSATFSLKGYEPTVYVDNFQVREGTNIINVGLVPLPVITSLEGTVTDETTGRGVMDMLVTLTSYRAVDERTVQIYHETRTDVNGFYRFAEVEAMDFTISFIKEGYETKKLSIQLAEEPNEFNISLSPIIVGLRLMFTNPKKGAVVWDARIYDIGTGRWIGGTPGGIKELHIPCDFDINFVTFLLHVMEQPRAPEPGPYWFGPYLVTIPALGAYTWNSREGRINGIKALDMPHATNESQVTGVISGLNWISEGQWGVSMTISETPGGERDFAQFFDNIYIRNASIPLDSLGAPFMKVGDEVTCKVTMEWGVYDYQWKAWDFKYVGEYPEYAYSFSGGLSSRDYKLNPWDIDYYHDISLNVRGAVPSFAVVLVQFNVYDFEVKRWTFTGPVSTTLKQISSWYKPYFRLYAHPNPSASWSQDRWKAERWVNVASLYVHWSDM